MPELSKRDLNLIKGAIRQAFHMSDHYRNYVTSKKLYFDRYRKDGSLSKVKSVKCQCELCMELFSPDQMDVDHKVPVGGIKSLDDVGRIVKAIFSKYEEWQYICTHCHKEKTQRDNEYMRWKF